MVGEALPFPRREGEALEASKLKIEVIQSIFSPLQSKACLTFEFITTRVLSIQEDPYQALTSVVDFHSVEIPDLICVASTSAHCLNCGN